MAISLHVEAFARAHLSQVLDGWGRYGGLRFPLDKLSLLRTVQAYEAPLRIVQAVVLANDTSSALRRKLVKTMNGETRGKSPA